MSTHDGLALDYVEHTGPVTRVGLCTVGDGTLPPGDATDERLREALIHLYGDADVIDVNVHADDRAEITVERHH